MLQGWLIALLTVEVWCYAWLTLRLFERGYSALVVMVVIVGIALLWRASHALVSFALVGGLRYRDGRHDIAGSNRAALWSEFCARLISFNWSQPFVGHVMGKEPAGRMTGTPVLLVHGYFSNRGMWFRFRERLVNRNIGPVYSINLEPLFSGIDEFARQVHERVEAICAETQSSQVLVIAHSLGGLVVRAYMATHGVDRVAQFITLGSPHHGTKLAAFGIGRCADQMQYHSDWLTMLAEMEAASDVSMPPTLSIYTNNDDLVYPPESSALPWAQNVAVNGVGHVALLFSPAVFALVDKAIHHPHR